MEENGFGNGEGSENHDGINYEYLLSVRYVDTAEKRGTWSFTVSDNFTIFISSKPHGHSHISNTQGIGNEDTLVEGYIDFNNEGKVNRIQIKGLYARGTLIREPREKQEKISQAIRNVIKKELDKS